ncbi:hypothetical protein SAMN05920897_10784 [Alkalispirochaeta americana]|uniref:CopG family transcriptional regulator n=1 Tax=Alkalispirochaeta americana TaxID=159291 RepID=A0A1N6S047_9SPIO|nr:ribbon-helix-helix domain-containing protein [Alkalispirochaeta americana]SIQ34493.1 hypothetical protein SAMN05920897_10784 [Alkalispirochaeta americana]
MNMKDEVITFKVDGALAEQLRSLPNRSEFIRQAVLQALEMECPLCHGTGTLSVNQMAHWRAFREHHRLVTCDVCGEPHLACEDQDDVHAPESHPAEAPGTNQGEG